MAADRLAGDIRYLSARLDGLAAMDEADRVEVEQPRVDTAEYLPGGLRPPGPGARAKARGPDRNSGGPIRWTGPRVARSPNPRVACRMGGRERQTVDWHHGPPPRRAVAGWSLSRASTSG